MRPCALDAWRVAGGCRAQVGTYKPNPDLRRKAEQARQKAAEDSEAEQRKARLEALAQRKQEKALEEKVGVGCVRGGGEALAQRKQEKALEEKVRGCWCARVRGDVGGLAGQALRAERWSAAVPLVVGRGASERKGWEVSGS